MDRSWAQGPGTLTADFLATWFWVGQRGFLGLNCPNVFLVYQTQHDAPSFAAEKVASLIAQLVKNLPAMQEIWV